MPKNTLKWLGFYLRAIISINLFIRRNLRNRNFGKNWMKLRSLKNIRTNYLRKRRLTNDHNILYQPNLIEASSIKSSIFNFWFSLTKSVKHNGSFSNNSDNVSNFKLNSSYSLNNLSTCWSCFYFWNSPLFLIIISLNSRILFLEHIIDLLNNSATDCTDFLNNPFVNLSCPGVVNIIRGWSSAWSKHFGQKTRC